MQDVVKLHRPLPCVRMLAVKNGVMLTLGSPGRGRSPIRRVSTTKVFSNRWCSRMVVRRSCA